MSTVDTIACTVMGGAVGFILGALFIVANFHVTSRPVVDQ